jgi:pimeloyl-ACP methyl ester carboxylesterase
MTFQTIVHTSVRATRAGLRAGAPVAGWAVKRAVGTDAWPDIEVPPAGRPVELPGRGRTQVIDIPGPSPDAPVVLLLHGIFTNGPLTWFSVLGALAQHYRVITFDQRWHGRGIASPAFNLDDCADDAMAVLDVLGIDTAVAVGYSMGGATAQVLWRRHAARVDGLVLCSTAARWEGNLGERFFYSLLAGVNRPLAGPAAQRVAAHREQRPEVGGDRCDLRSWALAELRNTSPWSLPVVLGALGDFDATGWIAEIDVPHAVVITGNDKAIPTPRQRTLAELLPDPLVLEAPGGHTSLVFDLANWRPLFLEAVSSVARQLPARDVL